MLSLHFIAPLNIFREELWTVENDLFGGWWQRTESQFRGRSGAGSMIMLLLEFLLHLTSLFSEVGVRLSTLKPAKSSHPGRQTKKEQIMVTLE